MYDCQLLEIMMLNLKIKKSSRQETSFRFGILSPLRNTCQSSVVDLIYLEHDDHPLHSFELSDVQSFRAHGELAGK